METENIFGQRLKRIREKRGLSQGKLADLCGIKSSAVISYWESGTNKPDIEKLKILCRTISVSADYLLGFDETAQDISFEAIDAAKKLDQLDETNRNELLNMIDMRLINSTFVYTVKQPNASVPGDIYLSKNDSEYKELKEKCTYLKSLKRERYRGYEDVTKFLWDCGYTSDQICLAYVIQIFNGKRVPCRELYERIFAYLSKDIAFTHKDGRAL